MSELNEKALTAAWMRYRRLLVAYEIDRDGIEQIILAYLAASPAPTVSGEPVAVKPLEWSIIDNGWWIGKGLDFIREIHEWGKSTDKIEALKAAAQADYEQHIRSALLPAPTRNDVLDEAALFVSKYFGSNVIADAIRSLKGCKA